MIATNDNMTNLQLEILKMFKYNLNDFQLVEVRE